MMATNFFRSIGIPCLLYIDDSHNGQLQVSLSKGQYSLLANQEDRMRAAANAAIMVVTYYLVRLGYFLALSKSVLKLQKRIRYLGFEADSATQCFHLFAEKRHKFLQLVKDMLDTPMVTVKSLQRLAGKCVSFSLVVPGAKLFTREMNSYSSAHREAYTYAWAITGRNLLLAILRKLG